MTCQVLKSLLRFFFGQEEEEITPGVSQGILIRVMDSERLMIQVHHQRNESHPLSFFLTPSSSLILTSHSLLQSFSGLQTDHHRRQSNCCCPCSSFLGSSFPGSSSSHLVSDSHQESLVRIGRNLRNISQSFDYMRNRRRRRSQSRNV